MENLPEEVIIQPKEIYRTTLWIFLISCIIFIPLFIIFYGWGLFAKGCYDFIFTLYISVPLIIAGIIAHEFLHAIVLIVFGQVKIGDISAGINEKYFSPYVHCRKPVTSIVYKISCITPAILLGILPSVLSLLNSNVWFLIFGILFTVGASGDIISFRKLLKTSHRAIVSDHPDEPGFIIH